MNEEELKQLIAAACKYPQGSLQWRLAMHRLLTNLQKLPGIRKSNHPDYLQALNQTFEWISRNICIEFVPSSQSLEKSLVNWINGYLYWRIKDLYLAKKNQTFSLDVSIGKDGKEISILEQLSTTNIKAPTLTGLDGYIESLQKKKIENIALTLENYLEEDPGNKLSSCHPSNCSRCNCQFLAQNRYLKEPPNTFYELSQQLNIPYRKLTNHWYGRCKPLLQKIAKDLGYKPELKQ